MSQKVIFCFNYQSNIRLVSNGGVWERDGDGMGTGTGTPFGDKLPPPPPPPVVSKGWVESGEFNKRATSRQPGGEKKFLRTFCPWLKTSIY